MTLRLFPLVLFAATSLLTLKVFDMVFSGEALLSGTRVAYASDAKTDAKIGAKAAQGAESKLEQKKEETKAGQAAPAKKEGEKAPSLLEGSTERPKEKIILPKGEESSEAVLNERLGEKRRQLEERNKEIDLRENLVKAAEKRIDDRMMELKQAEVKSEEGAKGKDEQAGLKIKNLVQMYEIMKPKEAAAIFEKLDMNILIEVASRMNPRVTSQVIAKMSPDTAQKLTAEMARRSLSGQSQSMPFSSAANSAGKAQVHENPKELPRIDGQQPKPR
jgi:flagellar motility protein MotE (MotC chaperone)